MDIIRTYHSLTCCLLLLFVILLTYSPAQAVEQDQSTRIIPHTQSYLFAPYQPITLKFNIQHALQGQADVKLQGSLCAYGFTDVPTINQTLLLIPGKTPVCVVQLPPQEQGLYTLNLTLKDANNQLANLKQTLGVLPPAQLRNVDPQSAFGTVAHLNRMTRENLLATVQNMSRIGIRWAREGFIWSDIEPVAGKMQWEHYDQLVDTCEKYGITVLPVLAYSTKWSTVQPPNDVDSHNQRSEAMPRLDAWQNYVTQVVERYKDRIHHWEIWNEPNSTSFFKPVDRMQQAQDYARLLGAAHTVIKQADAQAQVIIGGFTPKHWIPQTPHLHEATFMKAIYQQQPRPFDILGYHPYTAPHTDTTNVLTVNKYFKLTRFCWDVCQQQEQAIPETWMTEMGTPTMPFMTEDRAAEYLAVLYVTALVDSHVSKQFWYDFQNDGLKATNKEHNFGLLRYDGSPKPGYFAYLNLTTLLNDATHDLSKINPQWTMHQFSKAGQKIKIFWANKSDSVSVELRASQSSSMVSNILGQTLPFEITNGIMQLQLTQSPVYVIQ